MAVILSKCCMAEDSGFSEVLKGDSIREKGLEVRAKEGVLSCFNSEATWGCCEVVQQHLYPSISRAGLILSGWSALSETKLTDLFWCSQEFGNVGRHKDKTRQGYVVCRLGCVSAGRGMSPAVFSFYTDVVASAPSCQGAGEGSVTSHVRACPSSSRCLPLAELWRCLAGCR